jgi:hypothetical protein
MTWFVYVAKEQKSRTLILIVRMPYIELKVFIMKCTYLEFAIDFKSLLLGPGYIFIPKCWAYFAKAYI